MTESPTGRRQGKYLSHQASIPRTHTSSGLSQCNPIGKGFTSDRGGAVYNEPRPEPAS